MTTYFKPPGHPVTPIWPGEAVQFLSLAHIFENKLFSMCVGGIIVFSCNGYFNKQKASKLPKMGHMCINI